MYRTTFCSLGAALAVAGAVGCGGTAGTVDVPVGLGETTTMAALQAGTTPQRAYLGMDDDFTLGTLPVLAAADLLGGSQVELEVVTPDGSPVRFQVWRGRRDGTATLQVPVDATSGFALEDLDPDEDSTWLILFPGAQRGEAIVHMECVGGLHGCAQTRQPGQSCPAGFACDQGLTCELPIGVCGPLAGIGTCVPTASYCQDDAEDVCGCDGQTYSSECDARMAGVPILHGQACD
jgi:hypothetical protein